MILPSSHSNRTTWQVSAFLNDKLTRRQIVVKISLFLRLACDLNEERFRWC